MINNYESGAWKAERDGSDDPVDGGFNGKGDGRPQRPGIREIITEDMEALEDIAGFLDKHTHWGRRYEFGKMLEEFRKSLWRELDYRQEAHNLRTLGANLLEFPGIVVPIPIEDFTTSRVLTLEYIHGKKVSELSPADARGVDPVEQNVDKPGPCRSNTRPRR